ncbi:hypothetical protein [Rhodomicrobium lacus]|uniref:hypothetical protein n=1 Tax=Rhodomicrobium lacus TaxID=2498452 RepID=UPI0026E39C68|nr:hypothetical protein [Rhodomicrobium lacus]WKW51010.1 hypothetical protein QMO75_00490 [Rhodomicrobium lacus]
MAQTFSQLFGIGLDQPQLDFVDIAPSTDVPLFIDPFAISLKDDEWSRQCHVHITHFFQTALDHIRSGRHVEAKRLLNGLSEPNETCLGLSRGHPSGRGVSGKQAIDLYESLAKSQAAKTGLLEELADCDLFVEGIAADKISDITTNIIRRLLIDYTQAQCQLHNVCLTGNYPTGRFWDMDRCEWREDYSSMPVFNNKRLILVPKYSVRRNLCIDAQEYYSNYILNFIQIEEYGRGSSLVRTLRNGTKAPPFKKDLRKKFPFSKDFLARFSQENPEVLKIYKDFYRNLPGAQGVLSHDEFQNDFEEAEFAQAMMQRLQEIPFGSKDASAYHKVILGVLEFIFWPNLIYPKKEAEIHDGRKRIDIKYTNAARDGFFYRANTNPRTSARFVMVECKNYTKDPANPEIDQLSGRFSPNRGWLGLLLYRHVSDYDLLLARSRDTAQDGRGFMIPLGDQQICEYLDLIANGARSAIDGRLEDILRRLSS